MLLTASYLLTNTIVDVLYAVLDPRITPSHNIVDVYGAFVGFSPAFGESICISYGHAPHPRRELLYVPNFTKM